MDELGEKFDDWCAKDETHLRWQLNLINRLAVHENELMDIIYKYAPYSYEMKSDLTKLIGSLGELFDETRELFTQLAEDKKSMFEIFGLLQKEIEKLPDDTP